MEIDDSGDTKLASRLREILSLEEQKEARACRKTMDQHQFVMARTLVRLALSSTFLSLPVLGASIEIKIANPTSSPLTSPPGFFPQFGSVFHTPRA